MFLIGKKFMYNELMKQKEIFVILSIIIIFFLSPCSNDSRLWLINVHFIACTLGTSQKLAFNWHNLMSLLPGSIKITTDKYKYKYYKKFLSNYSIDVFMHKKKNSRLL